MSRRTLVEKPPKNELQTKYNKYGETISSLAKRYCVSQPTMRGWLKGYDIPRKSHKEASTQANKIKSITIPEKRILVDLYVNQGNTIDYLESMFGVGQQTVYQWLTQHQIPIRTLSESCKLGKQRQFSNIQFDKQQIENVLNKCNHNKFMAAEELGVSLSHIRKKIKDYGIDSYDTSFKSKGEVLLLQFCQQLRPDLKWISGDKSAINPFELDIYCPSEKLAIEYCGLYWHSEYWGQKHKQYHFEKWKRCNEKGIQLLTVFETDDPQKIRNLIIKKMKKSSKRIYARNTKVVTLTSQQANEFHRLYHLHGSVGGSIHRGLMYDNELCMVMSLGKSRFSKDVEYECTRMTTKNDYTVVGGASKLFNVVDGKSIVTFADLRFGNGGVYKKCGFVEKKLSPPNYWYYKKSSPTRLYSRVSFQKHKLKNKLETFDENISEYENMLANGWDRIWDCGNAKYVKQK